MLFLLLKLLLDKANKTIQSHQFILLVECTVDLYENLNIVNLHNSFGGFILCILSLMPKLWISKSILARVENINLNSNSKRTLDGKRVIVAYRDLTI